MTLDFKSCGHCDQTKSAEMFHLDKSSSTGLASWCKQCVSEYSKRRIADPEKNRLRIEQMRSWRESLTPRVVVTEKRCGTCKLIKPVSEFGKATKTLTGYNAQCRNCISAAGKKRYRKNHPIPFQSVRTETHKKCPTCKEWKVLSNYLTSRSGKITGTYCKPCRKIRAKSRRERFKLEGKCTLCGVPRDGDTLLCQKHRALNTEGSLEERQYFWSIQVGKCAVCQGQLPDLFSGVDHNHISGKKRGLVHDYCNAVVGAVETRPWLIDAVYSYLDRVDGF